MPSVMKNDFGQVRHANLSSDLVALVINHKSVQAKNKFIWWASA